MSNLGRVARAFAEPSARAFVVAALLLTSVVVAAFTAPDPEPTVHAGLFELGGMQAADILGDGDPTTGPDWAEAPGGGDGVFDGDGNAIDLFGGAAASFIMDELSQKGLLDSTTFSGAGGSNKNNDPITGWHWDAGNVPAKDDLSNAYAFATLNPSNEHLILYSGFERLDPSGDSHIDIEFFQDHVRLSEDVPCDDPGLDRTPCDFIGRRTTGDIIVSMDFTIGGTLGSLSVREWIGTQYVLVGELFGEGCNPMDTICGFNNGGPINGGPWPNYNRHGDEVSNLPRNAFTEFGVDVTALLKMTPCLSTMMGKTRSSQSFTAELKDFAGPVAFNVCGASIQIQGSAVNEVRVPHTFTVTVQERLIGYSIPAPDGTIATVTLTDANGASSSVIEDTCADPGTVDGYCTVTFVSGTAGTVTGHAAADVVIAGTTFHVETDGIEPNSGDAVKRYVDAFITIDPAVDTNSVGELHTFTVDLEQNVGDGAGFAAAPDGTVVTVTMTDTLGAAHVLVSDACATPGTSGGSCTVTFTSPTAGKVAGHASATLSIEGVSVFRETDGQWSNSVDATKYFVAGALSWRKVDNAGRLQGGATFQVCRTHDLDSETGGFVDVPDVCVDVLDNVAPDTDPADGKFRLTGLVLGRYTVKETIPPWGYVPDPDTVTVELSHSPRSVTIAEAFVNNRPIVKLSAFGYTNTAKGTPSDGVVSGITVFTIKLKNFGTATALVDMTFSVGVSDLGSGSAACTWEGNSDCTMVKTDIVLLVGDEVTLTLTLDYTDLPDGAVVTATLGASYTTMLGEVPGRTPSGAPAMIVFTIQGD